MGWEESNGTGDVELLEPTLSLALPAQCVDKVTKVTKATQVPRLWAPRRAQQRRRGEAQVKPPFLSSPICDFIQLKLLTLLESL